MTGNCCGFTSGINCKRAFFTTVAVFVTLFVTDFIIHGPILKSTYEQTPTLWRSDADMKVVWIILSQIVIAKMFSLIFAKGYEGKGIAEGVRFGILAGLFSIAHSFVWYAVAPLPSNIFMAWCGLGMAQFILAGIVASFVYKK